MSNKEYIPPESQPVKEDKKGKKDTTEKKIIIEEKPLQDQPKPKKKPLLQRLFGKKERNKH